MHEKEGPGATPSDFNGNASLPVRRPKKLIRILIADGSAIFRDGLRELLKKARDFSVVGEAPDGEMALDLAERLKPDIVLLDLKLPKLGGVDVLRRLTGNGDSVRVLAFSSDISSKETIQALDLGARGIILNGSNGPTLFEGIRRVMEDEYWVSPDAFASLVHRLRRTQPRPSSTQTTNFGLTMRELEVILEVVAGSSNPDIAKKLCLSEQTVKHHLTHIFDKLGVYNRTELAMFAMNHDLSSTAEFT